MSEKSQAQRESQTEHHGTVLRLSKMTGGVDISSCVTCPVCGLRLDGTATQLSIVHSIKLVDDLVKHRRGYSAHLKEHYHHLGLIGH